MTTDLIKQEITPKEVFKPGGLDLIISGVKAKKKEFLEETEGLDLSVKKNRDKLQSFAHTVARSKTFVDKKGKDFVAGLKAQAKDIDSERKRFRDIMDEIRDEIKAPVIEWENKETARIDGIMSKIEAMDALVSFDTVEVTSEMVQKRLDTLDAMVIGEDKFHEYVDAARDLFIKVKDNLESRLLSIKKQEEEKAELERLRKEAEDRKAKEEQERREREQKEREDRLKKEAAERAEREAEENIRAEREAKERAERESAEAKARAEQEKKEAAERAEREKQEAIAKAKREAEEKAKQVEFERLEKERLERKEAERKAANKRHQASVNNKVKAALVAIGVSEDMAKKIIIEAAQGRVPFLKIEY